MKKIKFRAWVIDGKYFKEGTFDLEDIAANIDDVGENLLNKRKIEWLQFTGLLDKNGKEIYEGDIIRIEETAISDNEAQRQIRGADVVQSVYVGSVSWCNESVSYDLVDKDGECIIGFPRHEQTYEVIGNIYENPELLEGKK